MIAVAEPVASPFDVSLERFSGPLDLLLHLIRSQDIDVFDIPIATITQQFLAAIEALDRMELERAGEFLEMAATLVRIKAHMLFPRRDGDDELEDPRAELVRPWGTRAHAVGSLLACLELAKRSLVRVRQSAPFSTLWVYRARTQGE